MDFKNNFAAFILTNGRPDRVFTYDSLRRHGYSGKIFLLVDDLDKTSKEYISKFGSEVIIFDKRAIAKTFDQGDNFNDLRAIIYARNASFEIAKRLGIKYFIQLDDDYTNFQFRFGPNLTYKYSPCNCLDNVFKTLLDFYRNTNIASISLSQGGDFIGGESGTFAEAVTLKRKCMNSFICSTDRPFQFIGRINEYVNTYTHLASKGLLMFTTNQVSLQQKQTQTNSGGMTELYLDSGTYVKSFYSVMYQPSSVTVSSMQSKYSRLHHHVKWRNTVPMILSEDYKKS